MPSPPSQHFELRELPMPQGSHPLSPVSGKHLGRRIWGQSLPSIHLLRVHFLLAYHSLDASRTCMTPQSPPNPRPLSAESSPRTSCQNEDRTLEFPEMPRHRGRVL